MLILNIFLLIFNLGLGFMNIGNNANPYVIACNFFAAGFIAMAAIAIAVD